MPKLTDTQAIILSRARRNAEPFDTTRRALLDTRQLIVHLTGEDKLELLHQAMLPGDVAEYPIRAVLQQHAVPCHIFHA